MAYRQQRSADQLNQQREPAEFFCVNEKVYVKTTRGEAESWQEEIIEQVASPATYLVRVKDNVRFTHSDHLQKRWCIAPRPPFTSGQHVTAIPDSRPDDQRNPWKHSQPTEASCAGEEVHDRALSSAQEPQLLNQGSPYSDSQAEGKKKSSLATSSNGVADFVGFRRLQATPEKRRPPPQGFKVKHRHRGEATATGDLPTTTNQADDYRAKAKVTATAGPVLYGATKSSAKRPTVVYSQWVHNGQASSYQTTTVERKTEHKKTATWHVENGFGYSGSVTASAHSFIVNIETKHQISLDLKKGSREEVSDTETFSVNQVVKVPPMKSVKIDWIITDAVQEVPWTSTVTVTGHFAIKFTEKLGGSFVWYYNLPYLKDPRIKFTGMETLLYTAKGTFTAVQGHEAHLRVTEHDYQAYGGRSSAVRTYIIPLSLTPHTPAAKTL
ncbi:uncharacterized protein LOC121833204 [Ixodes scapularis]|uniref:uncharacterized protein LOC121833204 n=1 Tax=Ixodes scapularis TaxID=6945 RepID=UPI001C38D632|nr:uncharacterized protein LOC121833204 [Ixodes scapularis]